MGTWHDTTHFVGSPPSGVNFEFTGVSLEVFCILPPNNVQAILNYSLTFEMDGKDVGTPFRRTKDELTSEYQYNVSVVSLQDLPNTKHNFTMVLKSKEMDSVALFDYAVYQFEDAGGSTNSSTISGMGTSAEPTSVTPSTAETLSASTTSPAPGSATSSGAQAGTGNNGAVSTLRTGHGEVVRGMLTLLIGLWVL
ncbi:hypothetical protein AAF712_008689 [Marasmius tenuissimus]|uniref:Uncharacterized protein n=1 Tax=Marasmius tenuissimus TaxID=585030 RepID=A0ABR2ZU68_9AGAR|nr:hypothetical protein PM082_010574 [Marasmius tenuissimus]KAJ8095343.1 hypothetical protein PM082_010566 [Marasmius tenuissimus]